MAPSPESERGAVEIVDHPVLVQVEQGQAVRYLVDGVRLQRDEVAPRLVELFFAKIGPADPPEGRRGTGLRRNSWSD